MANNQPETTRNAGSLGILLGMWDHWEYETTRNVGSLGIEVIQHHWGGDDHGGAAS